MRICWSYFYSNYLKVDFLYYCCYKNKFCPMNIYHSTLWKQRVLWCDKRKRKKING